VDLFNIFSHAKTWDLDCAIGCAVTQEIKDWVEEEMPRRRAVQGSSPRNSITNGKGFEAGAYGERIGMDIFGMGDVRFVSLPDYDFIIKATRHRHEVKTKERTVGPRKNFNCSIAISNLTQKADFYTFMSCTRYEGQIVAGYWCGSIPCQMFMEKAFRLERGDIDPDSPPGNPWTVKETCLNMRVGDLPFMT
jgi:hypothetical protein